MSLHSSFTAPPGKRYAAFMVDLLAVFLVFLVVAGLGSAVHADLGRWDVLAICGFLYQGTMIAFHGGQTIGRQWAGITVMSMNGSPVEPVRGYFRSMARVLPLVLLDGKGNVPTLGGVLLLALFVAETRLIERTPARMSVADRLAKTLVVNLPPPHTHRAPAGPMFSADDAEFGKPPQLPRR